VTVRVGVFGRRACALLAACSAVLHGFLLTHNADIVADNQPSYQVQQVIDGALDVAAAWGPMAGYYKAVIHAPLIIQPVNMMEDKVPMEFDMALAVPRGRPDVKAAIEQALEQRKSEIHQILTEFGVPLGGPSFVAAPTGEVLVETTERLALVTLHRSVVEDARRSYPGYLPTRADLYAEGWTRVRTTKRPHEGGA